MRCKHDFLISECNPCLSKILKHLVKTTSSSSTALCETETKCKKCYANAFIITSNQSLAHVLRTFTSDELETECGVTINLTSSCSNGLLEIGKCKSPENKWSRIIDRENSFVTSLQIPKGCGGCYSYDVSASVALVSTLDLSLLIVTSVTALISTSTQISIPAIVDLGLSEQLPRDVCVVDDVSDTPLACFTATTFPMIDTTTATETLGGLDLNIITLVFLVFSIVVFLFGGAVGPLSFASGFFEQNLKFSDLNITGTVCLNECQRLVPTLTIRKTQFAEALLSITDLIPPLTFSFSNIKLYLSGLSIKLVRLDSCKESCQCKNKV